MTSQPTSSLQGSCSICFEDLKQNDKISAIVCGHIYHHGCISQWIATKRQCPSCRRTVPKNGFVEKLFFDVQRMGGEAEKPPEIDYREEHYKLSTSLKVEQEKLGTLNTENKNLKDTVKSLEKKIIREKDKYRQEIPKLQATINHLTISSEETAYLKRELQESKNRLKTCEFYKILTVHSSEADKQLGEYLKKNGNLDTEKFFQLMKSTNKDLTDKRREAAKEIEQLKMEVQSLKRAAQEDAAIKKTLKKTVLDLRERANVDTPINNKRLRDVLETETPPPAKRKSMGFDESSQMIDPDGELSFFKQNENRTPVTSVPSTSKAVLPFNFDDDEDDEYFKTPKIAEKKKKLPEAMAPVSEDSFDFDIAVPQSIINRIPAKTTAQPAKKYPKIPNLSAKTSSKPTEAPKTENVLKIKSKSQEIAQKPQKSTRISSFFSRTTSSTSNLTEYVILD
ncbi:E3 ubiquitin-protein ligase trul-1 [Caenorhabditis elegans]|uniref:E3 ubiquitin-protein ligase trul-1 n=1 Tax=Caenorhabditis elegans TaxID=6239 RepID=TRUL_CAEEL|nr:E3 ubiquitin-protein ligase trul-1 [Caenorhabditis elegans]P90990.3 RecName: Full=E3 ubiquitin-protein ligase trul-1; AltName: Full=Traip ubiquitin ligase 1 [Caenorhabditis elegans]CCD61945.1 E3 ubiquitin-protein ligase trul-1 [Caenorhabditis elegans]|eukprot:NP_740965.2 TRaip (TRAIP) Ubiquitin Ligase 1 homolog [Caenorhabditis elegans]